LQEAYLPARAGSYRSGPFLLGFLEAARTSAGTECRRPTAWWRRGGGWRQRRCRR